MAHSKLLLVTIVGLWLYLAPQSSQAEKNYLFNFNSGSGTTFLGWTYYQDASSYGNPGWLLDSDNTTYLPYFGGQDFKWGYGPRCFQKGGDTGGAIASIDTSVRAPSTSTGGALKVEDEGEDSLYYPGWWVWYDGMNLGTRGITNSTTDRWSFYLKINGGRANTSTTVGTEFHVGTYLCVPRTDGGGVYGTGDGCPFEGPGNQHYYHQLHFSPGAWIHVELDQHPTHRRDSFVPADDPAYAALGKHYYEALHQFYMEIRYDTGEPGTYYLLDDMFFYSSSDPSESAEPDQNTNSVVGVWVGYWPDTGKWQIGWSDQSFETATGENTNETTQSTFQIKWSTSPITNENWDSATPISAEWFSGNAFTGSTDTSIVRRQDSWRVGTWTQFDLPAGIEASASKIYFAIKDVSVAGQHTGASYPWNVPDKHNAPSPYIRAIDYSIRASYLRVIGGFPMHISTGAITPITIQ